RYGCSARRRGRLRRAGLPRAHPVTGRWRAPPLQCASAGRVAARCPATTRTEPARALRVSRTRAEQEVEGALRGCVWVFLHEAVAAGHRTGADVWVDCAPARHRAGDKGVAVLAVEDAGGGADLAQRRPQAARVGAEYFRLATWATFQLGAAVRQLAQCVVDESLQRRLGPAAVDAAIVQALEGCLAAGPAGAAAEGLLRHGGAAMQAECFGEGHDADHGRGEDHRVEQYR